MKEDIGLIKENILIAKDTYRMRVKSKLTEEMKPGQFVNIRVKGLSLARPISICDIGKDHYTLIYKVVGKGTEAMSKLKADDSLDVFGPLGNGFLVDEDEKEILLIGGGIGVPPLYEIAKQYRKMEKKVSVVLGFNDKESVFYEEEFKSLGAEIYIATMDGSYGYRGNAVELAEEKNLKGLVYACGPIKMLEAVEKNFTRGYISKEARMACGLGACMACICKDREDDNLYYRICKEGPVFEIGRVI